MRKFEHLTATEARAIPIEDSLIKDTLEEIYGKIRKAAGWGQVNIYFQLLFVFRQGKRRANTAAER